jgi:nickel-dependent lactate racemase
MSELFLRYRGQRVRFDLPQPWELLTFAAFEDRPEPTDVIGMVRRALREPVNHPPLPQVVGLSDKVAIIIEDPSRSSPKELVLRALLLVLSEAGISPHQIVIVIALGTHRQLDREEMRQAYGQDLVDTYEFVNHDCRAKDLVPIGSLRSGPVVRINRRVSEADFKIGIGSVFPHPMNGFGGGGKILFPGVANFDAILEHHLKYSFRGASKLGNLQGNQFYEEVSDLARAAGLDFVINSVLDHNDRLHRPVCGAPVETHLAGVEISRKILSMPFPGKSDVTIISSFPYSEGTQIMKPLAPATEITREGGVVILACDYSVPLAESYLAGCESFRAAHAGRIRPAVLELFARNERILPDGAPEFNMSLAQALLGQHDFRIIVVSREMPRRTAERLGFAFAETIEQAIGMAQEQCPRAQVHVVPSGGVILPVVCDSAAP